MVEWLVQWFLRVFGVFTTNLMGKYISIFLISLMPILELRGGLIAASLMDLPMWNSFIVCLAANTLIIPLVLFLMENIMNFLSRFHVLKGAIDWLKNKTLKKKSTIEKYGFWGIMFFVAVPLPGSGAWTGCLLAVLLGLDKKKSFIASMLGVIIAGVIMLIFSYGILKGIID